MSIFLTGYRGSGKTTIGRRLAEALRQPFIDCDDRIIKQAGKNIRAIFAKDGESAFRELESQVIRDVSLLQNHVIALGGGALGRLENRLAVKAADHQVIFLRCHPAQLHQRIQGDAATAENRPNLTKLGGGIDEITVVLAEREPIYRATMTWELDVTNLLPEDALHRILDRMKT